MLLLTNPVAVIIVGCSLGLFGYDNNFVSPLLALPLFISKYQGYGPAFTVSTAHLTHVADGSANSLLGSKS